jgi:hypothetical protein
MKLLGLSTLILASALFNVSCATGELDGRKYSNSSAMPLQGKMGVTYKRVKADTPVAEETTPRTVESDGLIGALTGPNNEPPGLFDRNETPDEPGAEYWLKGQQSASPIQGKMGVRISRVKK